MAAKRRKGRPGRPLGGSEKVVRAILDATLRQLGEHGFAALNVVEVARAAGVNKTSVYRRWPSKAELVFAALRTLREGPAFVPTGDLRGDLVRILTEKAAAASTPVGRKIGRALIALEEDAEGASLAQTLSEHRYTLPVSLLLQAIDRGELTSTVDPILVSEMLVGLIAYRTVVLGEPVEPGYVERIVDYALAGIRHAPKLPVKRTKKKHP